VTDVGCPYKGLASFDESDQDAVFFFGRDSDRRLISANLMASKLTVLYGDTGVGKSSVLRAGVVRALREQGHSQGVVVFDAWKDDPCTGLMNAVKSVAGVEARGTLADVLEAWAATLDADVYVILDGFEEYFLYHENEDGAGTLFVELPQAIKRPGLRASFLIALREDALARLDRFKANIPNLLGNYLRLPALDRIAARSAIVGPVEQYNALVEPSERMEVEPAVVDAVLGEVIAGKVELGATGKGAVSARRSGEDRIEAPYLQLVMRRLWEVEKDSGSHVLRESTLRELGGAETIVRAHLEDALDSLDAEQRDIASAAFDHLVTPSGTKIAHTVPDLARYAGVEEVALEPVVSTLARERILRPAAADGGGPRYEIYHDVLGEAVLAWHVGHEAERTLGAERRAAARRQRRLLAALGVGAAVLVLMAGVTAYAFIQRSDARSHARQAQARQLIASALSALDADPSLSLSLAAEAARLDRSRDVETALRTAYLADRQRAVFPARGPISRALFSADGTRVIAASHDGHARIYDARTHALVRDLDHGAAVQDAAVDPGGRYVVTGGADGTARLWDSRSGAQIRQFTHGSPVRGVAISATGDRVVAAGGQTVSLWRRDGTRVAEVRWQRPVTAVSFNEDGSRFVVSGNDRVARVYDATEGKLLDDFDQGGMVTSASFSGGGARLLVTTGTNETARIWRLRDGKLVHELKGHRGSVLDAAFSPRASHVATASADGTGRIWDVRTGALVASLVGHTGIARSVAFSPDGNFVATGSDDKTATVSKVDNGDARAWLNGHTDVVSSVAFSPDGSTVLTGSADGTARLWDVRTQPQLDVLVRYRGPVVGASYAGTDAIAVAGPGPRVRLVSVATGRLLRSVVLSGPARSVASSVDGTVVGGAGGSGVVVFRREGRRIALRLPGGATTVAISADGSLIAGGGSTGVGRIWSADGQLRHMFRGRGGSITDIAFTDDGTRVATSSTDGRARLWDAKTGRLIRTLPGRKALLSVAYSPDGHALLTAGVDHTARLWDTETGALTQVLRWHFGRVADANFSPDGRWIVTAGPVTVGLWAPGVSEPILPYGFGGHKPLVTSSTFDPTSDFVLSSSTDGTVRRSECAVCTDLDSLLQLAKAQLAASGRVLTAEERERYGL
jgi:WD40 repeat protein